MPAVEEPGKLRRLAGATALGVRPLRRHRDFRLLFTGQALSFFGSEVTYVALPYQIFQLTHSTLAVGLVSLAEFVPLMLTAFVGGALSDAFDRRRMLQFAELGSGLAIGVLLLNSLLSDPQVWVLFVVAPVLAALYGILRPSLTRWSPASSRAKSFPPPPRSKASGAPSDRLPAPHWPGFSLRAPASRPPTRSMQPPSARRSRRSGSCAQFLHRLTRRA